MVSPDSSLSRQSFALNELDLKLRPYLNLHGGFFIEAGANDGVSQSNTLYFEKNLNWRGILIEPIPELAEKCRVNRPKCITENCALVSFEYDAPSIEMYYCNLMSLAKGSRKSRGEELNHIARGCQVQNIKSYELTVPARTLTAILDKHAIEKIDLLSLDVEGFELAALQGLDFEKYQPDFLLIEARYRDEIDNFLAPLYEPIADLSHHDVLYKSKRKIEAERGFSINTPVAFFIFNRPDLTETVFNAIAQAKPKKLLVIADGARSSQEEEVCQKTREIVNQVNWNCEVLTNFASENLGCKRRVSSGLDWVFSQVEEAIILEDDCVPTLSFFGFCEALLERYREDERIFLISGDNFQAGQFRTDYSYYFSRYPHIWGWATWRRAWKHFDLQMSSWPEYKATGLLNAIFEDPYEQEYWTNIFNQCYENLNNSWAYVWCYSCWSQNGLAILPEINLVSNIGFRADATHTNTQASPFANLPTADIWAIHHSPFVVRHPEADAYTFDHHYGGKQMKEGVRQLQEELSHYQTQCQQLQANLEQANLQQQQLQEQLGQSRLLQEQVQLESKQLQTELEKSITAQQQLQLERDQLQSRYQQSQAQLKQVRDRSRADRQRLKKKLEDAQGIISAMESSKFWQIRTQWFKLKKLFGRS